WIDNMMTLYINIYSCLTSIKMQNTALVFPKFLLNFTGFLIKAFRDAAYNDAGFPVAQLKKRQLGNCCANKGL
ncbi:MAG: hypothetical protein ACYS9V_14025, partial [Planctomycetota bacterium]